MKNLIAALLIVALLTLGVCCYRVAAAPTVFWVRYSTNISFSNGVIYDSYPNGLGGLSKEELFSVKDIKEVLPRECRFYVGKRNSVLPNRFNGKVFLISHDGSVRRVNTGGKWLTTKFMEVCDPGRYIFH